MAHIPINHHLRPIYRAVSGLIGLYLIACGVVRLAADGLGDLFDSESGTHALGLTGNGAFALLSIVMGLLVLLGVIVGRNLDHYINLWVGAILLVIGTAMLALVQTSLNVLAYSVGTVIMTFLLGMLLLAAGLYGKVGTPEQAEQEESLRHAS